MTLRRIAVVCALVAAVAATAAAASCSQPSPRPGELGGCTPAPDGAPCRPTSSSGGAGGPVSQDAGIAEAAGDGTGIGAATDAPAEGAPSDGPAE